MALETDKLKLHLIQPHEKFADDAFNAVIEDIDKKVVGIDHVQDKSHWELWQKNKAYSRSDIIRYKTLKSNQYALCIENGTSDATEPTINTLGAIIDVGTAKFQILDIVKGTSEDGILSIWLSGAHYERGILVYYGKAIYRCLQPHDTTTFELDKAKWQEVYASIRPFLPQTYYYKSDTVIQGNMIYQCIVAHTSGSNMDAGNWVLIGGVGGVSDFEPNTKYQKNQLVFQDGIIYRAKAEFTSTATFNIANWQPLTEKPWKILPWLANKEYKANEMVVKDNLIYMANTDHSSPTFNESQWIKLSAKEKEILLEDFKPNFDYKKDNFIMYHGMIYRAKNDFTSTGTFNFNDWEAVEIGADALDLVWKPNTKYPKDRLVVYNDTPYLANSTHISSPQFMSDMVTGHEKWRALNVGASQGEWKQVTNMNNNVGSTQVDIPIKRTLTYLEPPFEVLLLKQGATISEYYYQPTTEVRARKYAYNENYMDWHGIPNHPDGTLATKENFKIPVGEPTALGNGFVSISDEIKWVNFNSVESISL